jgi:hypothetical protein
VICGLFRNGILGEFQFIAKAKLVIQNKDAFWGATQAALLNMSLPMFLHYFCLYFQSLSIQHSSLLPLLLLLLVLLLPILYILRHRHPKG